MYILILICGSLFPNSDQWSWEWLGHQLWMNLVIIGSVCEKLEWIFLYWIIKPIRPHDIDVSVEKIKRWKSWYSGVQCGRVKPPTRYIENTKSMWRGGVAAVKACRWHADYLNGPHLRKDDWGACADPPHCGRAPPPAPTTPGWGEQDDCPCSAPVPPQLPPLPGKTPKTPFIIISCNSYSLLNHLGPVELKSPPC